MTNTALTFGEEIYQTQVDLRTTGQQLVELLNQVADRGLVLEDTPEYRELLRLLGRHVVLLTTLNTELVALNRQLKDLNAGKTGGV